jgi:ADP-ribosylglycohydrolase
MKTVMLTLLGIIVAVTVVSTTGSGAQTATLPAEVYYEKVYGAWLGECAGNMFGLPHELKYDETPGPDVVFKADYTDGARSDDDTDIEYVYLHALEEHGLDLSYEEVAEEWMEHIHGHIWVANARALDLMRQGVLPPATGHPDKNDKSWFNLSGQFTQELWGMVSPGMPAAAQRFADRFAHVVVYGESAMAAHFFCVMYAEAFFENDVAKLVEKGLSALPPNSEYRQAISDCVAWHEEYPDNWRAARKALHAKYREKWNPNSSVLNGAACTLGLLYGGGDFERTILLICSIGYDADCNAATVGGLLGVVKGARGLPKRWVEPLRDTYRNVTRDNLPSEEKISSIARRIGAVGEKVILQNGGKIETVDGKKIYRIPRQKPVLARLDPPGQGDGVGK